MNCVSPTATASGEVAPATSGTAAGTTKPLAGKLVGADHCPLSLKEARVVALRDRARVPGATAGMPSSIICVDNWAMVALKADTPGNPGHLLMRVSPQTHQWMSVNVGSAFSCEGNGMPKVTVTKIRAKGAQC